MRMAKHMFVRPKKIKKVLLGKDTAKITKNNEHFTRSKKLLEICPAKYRNKKRIRKPTEEINLISFTPDFKIPKIENGKTYVCKKIKNKNINDDKTESITITTNRHLTSSNTSQEDITDAMSVTETLRNYKSLVVKNEDIFNEGYPNSFNLNNENAREEPKNNSKNIEYNTPKDSTSKDRQSEENKCPKRGKRQRIVGLIKNGGIFQKHYELHSSFDESHILKIKQKKGLESDHLINFCSSEEVKKGESKCRLPKTHKGGPEKVLNNKQSANRYKPDPIITNTNTGSLLPHFGAYSHADSDIPDCFSYQTDIGKSSENGLSAHLSNKRKCSNFKTSSSSSMGESDKNDDKCLVQWKELTKERTTSLKGSNMSNMHKTQRQIRTKSVPTCHKKLVNFKLRSQIPVDSVTNFNRQSLKEVTERKRKQREIREQKIKERRERLEKERKERIRLSEQRLKQRFQQHEEMLKQKTEKFKIKSRNRQQNFATKRNLLSTSSKDSKEDRAENNDILCRNFEGSGQKLSKESNGYHDVSFRKVGLTSLEGNVGLHPEVSKKHNSILVGCEETPVEFFGSCNHTEIKKSEKRTMCQDVSRLKEFIDSKQSSFNNPYMNSKTPEHRIKETIKVDSKQSSFHKGSENSQIPYLLRSAKKNYPNKITENHSSVTSTSTSQNRLETKNLEPENTKTLFSENEDSKCITKDTNLCLNCSKTLKSKNYLKTPHKKKALKNVKNEARKSSARKAINSSNNFKKNSTSKSLLNKNQVEFYEDSGDSDDCPNDYNMAPKKIPLWATGVYLKQALLSQFYKPPNLDELFGIIPDEPVDLVAMFGNDKPHYHVRTSSKNWNVVITPT